MVGSKKSNYPSPSKSGWFRAAVDFDYGGKIRNLVVSRPPKNVRKVVKVSGRDN
jgi:hypothetical protein